MRTNGVRLRGGPSLPSSGQLPSVLPCGQWTQSWKGLGLPMLIVVQLSPEDTSNELRVPEGERSVVPMLSPWHEPRPGPSLRLALVEETPAPEAAGDR